MTKYDLHLECLASDFYDFNDKIVDLFELLDFRLIEIRTDNRWKDKTAESGDSISGNMIEVKYYDLVYSIEAVELIYIIQVLIYNDIDFDYIDESYNK